MTEENHKYGININASDRLLSDVFCSVSNSCQWARHGAVFGTQQELEILKRLSSVRTGIEAHTSEILCFKQEMICEVGAVSRQITHALGMHSICLH